jgi:AraC-like DNA-binding protein
VTSRASDTIPLVPVSYAARFVAMLEERGVDSARVLAGTGYTRAQLDDPTMRMPIATIAYMLVTGVEITGDLSLGLELGLGFKASSHGQLGFALITCNSIGDAISLSERYMELRSSPWRIRLIVEGETAIMRFIEGVTVEGPARAVVLEAVLGAVISLGEFMMGEPLARPEIEFWSDSPELPHHARFRDRVPRVRYNCKTIEARFPARFLQLPLALREPVANREAVSALENERRLLDPDEDLVERTRTLLSDAANRFPDLEQVAGTLGVASRTLRRQLSKRGTTFQALRDEIRRAYAITLLEQSAVGIDQVAHELNYADAATFVRAFQRWTGESPSTYRKRVRR